MYTDVSSNNDVKIPQRLKDTLCVTATAIAFFFGYRVIVCLYALLCIIISLDAIDSIYRVAEVERISW